MEKCITASQSGSNCKENCALYDQILTVGGGKYIYGGGLEFKSVSEGDVNGREQMEVMEQGRERHHSL